ncbi:MAG: exosortase O [Bacteroidia bacterium]
MLKKLINQNNNILQQLLFGFIVLFYGFTIFPSFIYIYKSITEHFDLQLCILIILGIYFISTRNTHLKFNHIFRFYINIGNVLLFLVLSVAFPLVSYFIHINLLSTIIGLGGLFTLFSFVLPFETWKKGLIPFTLLLMCLPFGRQLDTYIGFPLRLFTVDFVVSQMHLLNLKFESRDTILVIENRASQVDIDCSGVKGLWIGLIFFITYSWINKLKFNGKWLLLFIVLCCSLLFFNLIRVSILVFLNSSEKLQKGVQLFHYSIAAFGMVLSCFLVHFLAIKLNLIQKNNRPQNSNIAKQYVGSTYSILFSLMAFITFLNFIPSKPINHKVQQALPLLHSNDSIFIAPISFKSREQEVFEKDGSLARKFSFKYNSIIGEAIIVIGSDWRAQHKPELCFEAEGNTISSIQTLLIDESFPVKYLLFNHKNAAVFTWFQSPKIITDDFSYRNWLELSGKENNWVLINIVVNKGYNNPEIKDFLKYLKTQIHQSF